MAQAKPWFAMPQPDEDGNLPDEPAPLCSIPDLLCDNELFAHAGISLGKQQASLLQKSMKTLAQTSQALSLRFFGKFATMKDDYYIVEAVTEGEADGEEGEEEKDPTMEEPGTGVNKFTYFATSSPFEKWTKLPQLSPGHLASARKIRHMLTGNLDAPIIQNPFFFG